MPSPDLSVKIDLSLISASSWCSANVSYPLKAAEPVVRHARPQTFYCDTSFELSGSGVLLCNRGRVEGTFPKCGELYFQFLLSFEI